MRASGRAMKLIAAAAIIAAVALSAWAGTERHRREEGYRTVTICVDYEEFSSIAARWPEGPEAYWREIRKAGAQSVSVPEATLRWLEDAGYVRIEPLGSIGATTKSKITPMDPISEKMISERIEARLGAMVERTRGGFIVSGLTLEQLRGINIGPNEYVASLVKDAGLSVVLKLSAFVGFGSGWIEEAISDSLAKRRAIVFSEKTVGGYPNRIKESAAALVAQGILFGRIEFARQLGSDELSEAMYPNVVAVHSIPPEELAKGMPKEVAVDRFALAARERNMRLLYVNAFRFAGERTDVAEFNIDYVRAIAERVSASGLILGQPAAVADAKGPDMRLLLASSALGSSAALYLMLRELASSSAAWLSALSVLLLSSLAFLAPEGIGRLIVPLAAAIAMPSLAVLAWIRTFSSVSGASLLKSLAAWAAASAVSVAGGLMLASSAADAARMVGIGVFTGVKLAQLLPLGFAVLAFWALIMVKPEGKGLAKEAAGLGAQPILWWQAAAVGLAGAAGLYMVLRSGNTSPGMVSGIEEAVREALSKILTIRPRSKEAFIGHPAMICAGVLLAGNRKALSLAAFAVGMVGQVSMVNTFMHLHTPIQVTVARTFLGLSLGLAAGLAAAMILGASMSFLKRKGLIR